MTSHTPEDELLAFLQAIFTSMSWNILATSPAYQTLVSLPELSERLDHLQELTSGNILLERSVKAVRNLQQDIRNIGKEQAIARRVGHPTILAVFQKLEAENIKDPDEWLAILQNPNASIIHPDLEATIFNQAATLLIDQNTPESIRKAAGLWEKAIEISPDGSYTHLFYLNLGIARRKLSADPAEVATFHRKAWQLTPPDEREAAKIAGSLEISLQNLFDKNHDPSLLRELIGVEQRLIDTGAPNTITSLSTLSLWMYNTYHCTHLVSLLDGTIELSHLAVQHGSGKANSTLFANLGSAYATRYHHNSTISDLEKGIAFIKKAIEGVPERGTDWIEYSGRLAQMYTDYHEYSKEAIYLDKATQILQQLTGCSKKGTVDHAHALSKMATVVKLRNGTGDPDTAIRLWEEASMCTDLSSQDRAGYQHNAVCTCLDKFYSTGDPACLDQAEEMCSSVQDITLHPSLLDDYTRILRDRFELSRDIDLLDKAIGLARQLTDPGNQAGNDDPLSTALLCGLLYMRFQYDGQKEHLYESKELAETRLARNDNGDGSDELLRELAIVHHHLFFIEGNFAFLDKAVEMIQRAIGITDDPVYLNTMATILKSRFDHTGKSLTNRISQQRIGDLNRAIKAALASVRDKKRARPIFYSILSTLLFDRLALTNELRELNHTEGLLLPGADSDDLRDACMYGRLAVAGLPPNPEEAYMALHNFAIGLIENSAEKDIELRKEAARYEEKAAALRATYSLGKSNNESREKTIEQVRHTAIGLLTAGRWSEACQLLDGTIPEAKSLIAAHSLPEDRSVWLRSTIDLWKLSAYALAKMGDFDRAIERLEDALGQQLRERLPLNSDDLQHLARQSPQLFSDYQAAAGEYAQVSGSIANMTKAEARADHVEQQFASIRNKLQLLLSAIRKLPGFERFQSPLSGQQIKAGIRSEPLVYIVYSAPLVYSIIVLPGKEARLVEMPSTALAQTMQQFTVFSAKLAGAPPTRQQDVLDSLDQLCRESWTSIMGKLMEPLKNYRSAIFIPTGLFSFFPLHASWTTVDSGKRVYAQDHLCFTYAASATTFFYARELAPRSDSKRLLSVGLIEDEGYASLPYSAIELRETASLFTGHAAVLQGKVTKAQLLGSLSSCDVFHFSGHGEAGYDPLDSSLLLSDGEALTIRDLLNTRFDPVQLAFLSACESGMIGLENPEESIGLPTALLQCGFAAVCSSMWKVPEESAMLLSTRFYQLWKEAAIPAVSALRQAAQWLRNLSNAALADFYSLEMGSTAVLRLDYNIAAEKWARYAAADNLARPFAHPFYWAPFVLSGTTGQETTLYPDVPPIPHELIETPEAGSQPTDLPVRDLFEVSISEADIRELARQGDTDQLMQLFFTLPPGTVDHGVVSPETALLIQVAQSLSDEHGLAFLRRFAVDGAAHELVRLIAAEAVATHMPQRDAVGLLDQIAADGALSPLIRLLAADATWCLGDTAKAIQQITAIGSGLSRQPTLLLHAALLLCEIGSVGTLALSTIIEDAQRLPSIGIIETEKSLSNQAMVAFQNGNLEAALLLFDALIRRNDSEPVQYFNRGMIYYHLSRHREAIEDFTEAIARDPSYEKAYGQRGVAYAALQEHDSAIADLTKAIKLKPGVSFTYTQRSKSFEATGRYQQAREDLERAKELSLQERPEPQVTRRRSINQSPEQPAPDVRDVLHAIGGYELVVGLLANGSGSYPDHDCLVDCITALDKLQAFDELQAILRDPTIPIFGQIEAAYALEKKGRDTGGFLADIAVDDSIRPDDRMLAIYCYTRQKNIGEIKDLVRKIGVPEASFDELPAAARCFLAIVRQLAEDNRSDDLIELATDPVLPLFLHEISGEMLWMKGMQDISIPVLQRIAADGSAPAPIRWMAINAFDHFESIDIILPLLQHLQSSASPEGPLKQRVRALLLELSEERITGRTDEGEAFREAWATFMGADSPEKISQSFSEHPVMRTTSFIRKVRETTGERANWFLRIPWVDSTLAKERFFAASSKKDLLLAIKEYPVILSQDFFDDIQQSLAEGSTPSDRKDTELRLQWLASVPKPPRQAAMDELLRCKTPEDVKKLAARFPFTRKAAFRAEIDLALQTASAGFKRSLAPVLQWLEVLSFGNAEEETRKAFRLHHTGGDSLQALEMIGKVLDKAPDFADGYLKRAIIYGNLKRDAEAVADLTKAVELEPDNALMHRVLAKCLFNLQRPEEAISSADRAISLHPAMGEAYQIRGSCRYQLQQWKPAVLDFTMAIQHGVNDWLPLYMRAIANWHLHKEKDALTDVDQVLEKEPEMYEAMELKANLLVASRQPDAARELLKKMHEKGFGNKREFGILYENFLFDTQPNAEQAIGQLIGAPSIEVIEDICAACPFVMEPLFLTYLRQHLVPRITSNGRPSPAQQLEWLEQTCRNPQHVSILCFQLAATAQAVQAAVTRFPNLARPENIRMLESWLPNTPADLVPKIRQNLQWLRQATLPPDYAAFFAFEESRTKEALETAVQQHYMLCEPDFQASLLRSIEQFPPGQQQAAKQQYALLLAITQNKLT